MSSPDSCKRNPSLVTPSFLNTTNPEIFRTSPRPGGAVHINDSDFKTSTKIGDDLLELSTNQIPTDKVSKEFRVQTALDETFSSDTCCDVTTPDPSKDAMYMFGVTISSIIMMAANHPNIPQEYLDWAVDCLRCVRDDFGNHPPNVQSILNHIQHLKPEMGEAKKEEEGVEKPEEEGVEKPEEEGVEKPEGEGAEKPEEEGVEKPEEGSAEEPKEEVVAEGEDEGEQTIRTTTKVKMGSKEEVN